MRQSSRGMHDYLVVQEQNMHMIELLLTHTYNLHKHSELSTPKYFKFIKIDSFRSEIKDKESYKYLDWD